MTGLTRRTFFAAIPILIFPAFFLKERKCDIVPDLHVGEHHIKRGTFRSIRASDGVIRDLESITKMGCFTT